MTTAPATVEQPDAEQPQPKPQAKPAASKAPAKPAARKPAAAKPAAKAAKPAPQTPTSPLTPEQKRELGNAVITAAAKALSTPAVKDLPAETVIAQVAAWLKYVPHTTWPADLPVAK